MSPSFCETQILSSVLCTVPFRSCVSLCTVQYMVWCLWMLFRRTYIRLRRKMIVMQMSWGCSVKGGRNIMEHSYRQHAVKLHWHGIMWPKISTLLSQAYTDIKNLEPYNTNMIEKPLKMISSRLQMLNVCQDMKKDVQTLQSSINYCIWYGFLYCGIWWDIIFMWRNWNSYSHYKSQHDSIYRAT
jgi:hypothetical protein